jgi:dCMP deaminase
MDFTYSGLMNLAKEVASWSNDPSRKVGCVIAKPYDTLVAMAHNQLPLGIEEKPERILQRPAKYLWTEHAERNAIYQAARRGISTDHAIIFIAGDWKGPPCADCARAIIQSGIGEIVVETDEDVELFPEYWKESRLVALELIKEADINYTVLHGNNKFNEPNNNCK